MSRFKIPLIVVSLFSVFAARIHADETDTPVRITVEWLDHEKMGCEGCEKQLITLFSGSSCVWWEECDGEYYYIKISPKIVSEGIEISVIPQTKKSEKEFLDRIGATIVVNEKEAKELIIEDHRFRVSGEIVTDPNR